MHRALNRATVEQLVESHDGPCVSIFLPTHRGPEAGGDRVLLRSMLTEAESGLGRKGVSPEAIAGVLAPVRDLLADPGFWRSRAEGLALFASGGRVVAVRLDRAPEAVVEVGERFLLTPLVTALSGPERFYVLALALRDPRVLQVTPEGVSRLELPALPSSLEEALGYEQFDTGLQYHSAGPGGPLAHGHGDDDAERSDRNVVQYFRRVAEALAALPDPAAPLVLASVAEHVPLFREAGGDGVAARLLPGLVAGSPARVPDAVLADRAREVVLQAVQAETRLAVERYRELADRERALHDPDLVVRAASEGRVDTLFVVPGTRRWGRFEPGSLDVRFHAIREPGDDDLVDLAVALTLRNRGKVVATSTQWAPNGAPLAAILRH